MLGTAWLVLSVLTPLYHPYARLWLTLHAAGWLLIAGAIHELGPFAARLHPTAERDPWEIGRIGWRGVCAVVNLGLMVAISEPPYSEGCRSGGITSRRPTIATM